MLFSDYEKEIITDKKFLAAKIRIIDKIQYLFEDVRKELKNTCNASQFNFPDNVDTNFGKIFKGENYRNLPYVVLDYPKLFSKDSVFAFRTMFWWGHFYSLTLHLQGNTLRKYRAQFIQSENLLLNEKLHICVNDNPWEYHYDNDNYLPLNQNTFNLIYEHKFLKLSTKLNLSDFEYLPILANRSLNFYLKILS